MKIVYIAHPISGNVKENLKKIVRIARNINLEESETVPCANYFLDCYTLNDDIPTERERGIKNGTALMKKCFYDEIRLYGDRISKGMYNEISMAHKLGIPVVPMTRETIRDYKISKYE